ncbi:MAG: hypothetical protein HKP58_19695 [Desulfatitalea sp.]|nr:hypothetical protein [Desulfatitalea sp.]NNK02641.1 hypothetical protein [Desulfatitalea sp.]
MDRLWHDAIRQALGASRLKKVYVAQLETAVRRLPIGLMTDFEIQRRLLETLKELEKQNHLRLPRNKKKSWTDRTGLPRYVTAVRIEADAKHQANRKVLDDLRHKTAWEPTWMVAIGPKLRTLAELKRAAQVNQYLLRRPPAPIRVPHRERALEIFGDEKALDTYVRSGLFGGRLSLDALDCFYCPEPLPYLAFSLDPRQTRGKPLLVVENANTYWSCCQANDALHHYGAVVYGRGFAACAAKRETQSRPDRETEGAAERANDGLRDIETRLNTAGIHYFGDLDPPGIYIAFRINRYREKNRMPLLLAHRRLYQALLKKNLSAPADPSHAKLHYPDLARQWLGPDLAGLYLQNAGSVRWPQEGLTTEDIIAALIQDTGHD